MNTKNLGHLRLSDRQRNTLLVSRTRRRLEETPDYYEGPSPVALVIGGLMLVGGPLIPFFLTAWEYPK